MRARETGASSINSTQSVYYMIKVLLAVLRRPAARAARRSSAGDDAPVAAEHGDLMQTRIQIVADPRHRRACSCSSSSSSAAGG